jgi:hypothetical protein
MPTQGTATPQGELFDLDDFAITIPEGFAAFGGGTDLVDALERDLDANGEATLPKKLRDEIQEALQGGLFKLMVFDMSGIDPEFLDNMNVIVQPLPERLTRQQVVEMNIRDLASVNAELIKQDRFATDQHEFDRLYCALPDSGTHFTNYMLVHGSKLFVVTFSSKPERAEAFRPAAEEMMRSFRAK